MSTPHPSPARTPAGPILFVAALALAALIPLLGIPVYFRTDDVHWLGWALTHPNPLAAFDPAENLFGYYRPLPTIAWWIMARLFGFEPLGYQLVLAALSVAAMVPLYRMGRRFVGEEWGGLLAVGLFHALNLTLLYYIFWYSALTFALELLLLLFALDALLDGESRPGRPVAFVVFGILAGLAKQPALLILPLVGGGVILAGGGSRKRRWTWAFAIALGSLALLLVTPFVAHRPEALSAMADSDRLAFLRERFDFYARVLLRGPAGPLSALAAVVALVSSDGTSRGRVTSGVVGGAGAALALRFLPLLPGSALWLLLLAGAAICVPATRPWLAGFLLPTALLLGVDFHVSTYLLEPLLCLVPATLLWLHPVLTVPGRHLVGRVERLPRAAAVVPIALVVLAGGVLRDRVAPLKSMRDVRAVFRSGVDYLVSRAPEGTTVGCLSYEELGRTYADIRRRPLGERVGMHKTMNPAQLEKFLHLRGRADLSVVSLSEAEAAAGDGQGGVYLLAMNRDEAEIMERLTGIRRLDVYQSGAAEAVVYLLRGQALGFRDPNLK